ncbi:MAG: hypothetical protein LCI00_05535 [Chloroflexi bacterium]|nr:hypothetical protein [Chloroflexota bacterium]
MWPTPTPIPIGTPSFNVPIDPEQVSGQFLDNIIQGWNTFDSLPISTIFFIVLLLLIVFVGLWSIKAHLEKL